MLEEAYQLRAEAIAKRRAKEAEEAETRGGNAVTEDAPGGVAPELLPELTALEDLFASEKAWARELAGVGEAKAAAAKAALATQRASELAQARVKRQRPMEMGKIDESPFERFIEEEKRIPRKPESQLLAERGMAIDGHLARLCASAADLGRAVPNSDVLLQTLEAHAAAWPPGRPPRWPTSARPPTRRARSRTARRRFAHTASF